MYKEDTVYNVNVWKVEDNIETDLLDNLYSTFDAAKAKFDEYVAKYDLGKTSDPSICAKQVKDNFYVAQLKEKVLISA